MIRYVSAVGAESRTILRTRMASLSVRQLRGISRRAGTKSGMDGARYRLTGSLPGNLGAASAASISLALLWSPRRNAT